MSSRLRGRVRPMLAAGVLSLAVLTACSSGGDADDTAAPTTGASSSVVDSDESSSESTESGEATASAPTGSASGDAESADPESSESAAAPSDSAEGQPSAEAPTGEAAGSDPAATEEPAAPGSDGLEVTEGTSCGGLTVEQVSGALTGVTLESALEIPVDAGDSSCIFGTSTTIDTIVVDRYALQTYLGGELADLGDAEVLDAIAEVHGTSQTEVQSSDSTVGDATVRTLTGTDLTGSANALSFTVVDGFLVAVSLSGPALVDAGLAESSVAVLELAIAG